MAAPGKRVGKKEKNEDFYRAILLLQTEEECYSFFRDVCTINELLSISQRLDVARMLCEHRTYLDISNETGASTATISRVNRSLSFGNDGYNMVFSRMGMLGDETEAEEKNRS